jgi:hypothetical protein
MAKFGFGSVLFVLVVVSLTSCSNKEVYESIQGSRKLECQKLPPGQFDACLEQHGESYESYERDRKEILDEPR